MAERTNGGTSGRGELAQYLWDLRKATGMTLREVEEASERRVSNAYLSQLENGKIASPSPGILFELATVYESRLPANTPIGCSYDQMMIRAGYIRKPDGDSKVRRSRLPTFATEALSDEEESELLKYLAFIRHRKGHK